MSAPEDFFNNTSNVGLDLRLPNPDLGPGVLDVDSMRFHQGISGPGIIVEGRQASDGSARGFRIQLGGKFPQYGERDTKLLTAALMGYALDDPRAASIGKAEIAPFLSAANPAKGRRIKIDTTESAKVDPKTGQKYRTVRPFALGSETPPASAGAPAPSAPLPPPPPPAASSGPPPGLYALPESDPRHATHWYNASGVVPK